MTVPATTRRAGPFTGNGVTTSFPFTFKTFDTEDVAVTLTGTDALESTLVLDSDYSVTLNGDQDASPGGSITYPISGAPLAVGEKLTAVGAVPYDQTADLPTGGSFSPVVIENALDRATNQIQQLAEELGRSLTLPPSAAGADTTLPVPEANKVIGWNSTADALVNLDSADLASVVVAGTAYTDIFDGTGAQTAFALTANPGGVNALDIAISGVSQVNGVDFTVSGATLTFTSAPPAATGNICVRYVAALPVGTSSAQDVTFSASISYPAGSVGAELRRDVYPEQVPYGAIGDGTTDDTAAIQAAITALTSGQTLHLTGDYKITGAGLTITNKSRINIVGPGRVKMVGANVDAVHFRLVGTCDDVKILGVHMEGAGNAGATYFQYGVWSASGQTLSNVLVAWCHFKNLNTGVSFNADSGGTYTNAWALHNTCEDMLGVNGGQGYGIHCSKVTNCHIVGNTILRAQRHSIYAARGSVTPGDDYGVMIHENIIRDHRAAVNGVIQRPAIYCARGYGYSVKNNKIIGYYDGAIGISHDTVDLTSAGDSIVSGNQLFNRKNAVQSVWVGEAANPTSYRTKNVVVSDNFFRSDIAVGGYAQEISVFNGLNVDVIDNHFFIANITNIAYRPIVLGEYAAQGALDLDRVCVMDNTLGGSISGAGYAPVRFVYCATAICSIPAGGASRVRIENNDLDEDLLISTVEFQATQTNPKLVTRDRWGGVVGIYIAADTSPSVYGGVTQVRITNAGAVNITTLDDPTPAQRVALAFTDAFTTIKHATGNIRLAGGVDFVGTAKDVLTLEYSAADAQWFECGRALNA